MIRCPSCGRRLADAAPVCALHGAAPAPPAAADDATPLIIPTPDIVGFRVGRTLGRGGFGAVFLADRIVDGQQVAIKVARADNVLAGESLVREVQALIAIGPPHVPAVFEQGVLEDGSVYAALELVRAPLLADRLTALDGPMPFEEFARVAPTIVAVLEAAHTRGFLHCDLKPENIFVEEKLGAKLFDFGLVRRLQAGVDRVEATKEEAPAGTPEYMSPEQCEGRLDLDARSDIYALGVILYEMLSGAPPFWGNSAEVQQNHRSRRPPTLSRRVAIAATLEDAIMRCLGKDPDRRFQTVADLRQALGVGLAAERARRAASVGLGAAPRAPTVEPNASAKPAAARERRAVALLFFESKGNVGAVREAMNSVGAQLAHTAGAQYVLAFGHEIGDNPTRAATAAGEMLMARGLTKRALVDLASVSIQARPDGTRRFQSPLFARKEHYPGDADPEGVLLSPSALEVLPDLPTQPVAARPGFALLLKAAQASERTTTRMGVAPLVGRDELLRTLLESARAATGQARPTIVTLTGETGHGKTHLAQTLVQHLEILPKMQVLFIRAKEMMGGEGEQTTRELLRATLSLPEVAPSDLGRTLLASRLGPDLAREVWGGVAVSMGWAAPDHPELRSLAAAPGALRSAAARAAGEGLRAAARKAPIALVIEDGHYADETALDAIELAALAEAGSAIWACVVARPSFGRGRTGWATRAAEHKELTLPPLDPTAAAELARRLLAPAENVPASALARLAARTEGIPLLLVELVRGLKRDGLVRKSGKGQTWVFATDELDRLPDLPLVQWLASRETELLPPDLMAHARLASVLGTEFSADDIEGVLQELERQGASADIQLDAGIGVRRLAESGILVRHRGGRVGFRHTLLRDTVYQSVPPPQREAIHRAAFEYYGRQERLADGERLPPMAFHAARSGLKAEAGRLYLDLGQRSRARHAYLDAELLFRNALENISPDDRTRRISAAQGRGQMRHRLGRNEDALKDYADALDLARQTDAKEAEIDIMLDEGVVLDLIHDWVKGRSVNDEVEALIAAEPGLRSPVVDARLLMSQGRSLWRADKLNEALERLRQAIAVSEPLGEDAYEAYTLSLSMGGFIAATLGNVEEGLRHMNLCLRVFEEHGDMLGLCGVLINRCIASFLANDIPAMLADCERSLHIAREFGLSTHETTCVQNLGEIYLTLGQPSQAEPHIRRARDMYAQTLGESAARVSYCETQLARLKWYSGEVEAAGEIARAVSAKQAEAGRTGQTESLLGASERLLLEQVELALRQGSAEEFDALIERGRGFALQPPDIVELMEWKALTALRAGRREEGLRFLEDTLAEARKNAPLTVDRVLRQWTSVSGGRPTPELGLTTPSSVGDRSTDRSTGS